MRLYILHFLRATRGSHDEGGILLEQVPDGRDAGAAILVEGPHHCHMLFTKKLLCPRRKGACHWEISFSGIFSCSLLRVSKSGSHKRAYQKTADKGMGNTKQ